MIQKLDEYFDAVPRSDSDPVDVGAFTLFVSRAPFLYYARPARNHPGTILRSDLEFLEKECASRNLDLSIEWVHETHPELAEVAADFGLDVHTYALLVATFSDLIIPQLEGGTVRIIGPNDVAIEHGIAVAEISFGVGGTKIGESGSKDRDAAVSELSLARIEHLRERLRRGFTVSAVAESPDGVLASGSYQRVNEMAEITGVATLPSLRRRGLGGAVAALLVKNAFESGVETVLLSAEDENVARVYQRIGFHRVGHTCAAERKKQ